jgi:hypothetical protein
MITDFCRYYAFLVQLAPQKSWRSRKCHQKSHHVTSAAQQAQQLLYYYRNVKVRVTITYYRMVNVEVIYVS